MQDSQGLVRVGHIRGLQTGSKARPPAHEQDIRVVIPVIIRFDDLIFKAESFIQPLGVLHHAVHAVFGDPSCFIMFVGIRPDQLFGKSRHQTRRNTFLVQCVPFVPFVGLRHGTDNVRQLG